MAEIMLALKFMIAKYLTGITLARPVHSADFILVDGNPCRNLAKFFHALLFRCDTQKCFLQNLRLGTSERKQSEF